MPRRRKRSYVIAKWISLVATLGIFFVMRTAKMFWFGHLSLGDAALSIGVANRGLGLPEKVL